MLSQSSYLKRMRLGRTTLKAAAHTQGADPSHHALHGSPAAKAKHVGVSRAAFFPVLISAIRKHADGGRAPCVPSFPIVKFSVLRAS